MVDLEQLRYPVGKFSKPEFSSPEQIKAWIQDIEDLPGLLVSELQGLTDQDLLKTYRPGGWTINQVVHHLADSHMNSFIRFKLSLTEHHPVIKPYLEDAWAEMPDDKMLHYEASLQILVHLHVRWVYLLLHMNPEDFTKGYIHPEKKRLVTLEEATSLYSWHSRHHLEHIRLAKRSKN
ncbi:MAG: bacillithiol transferase BstA [Saprospiraceae bacterium]|nr:bacillithiol transferase BstA [Saprospiraceae bacterium]